MTKALPVLKQYGFCREDNFSQFIKYEKGAEPFDSAFFVSNICPNLKNFQKTVAISGSSQ